MIRLSIIMPTNRDNLTAFSRIAQACSWAGSQTEVIISDNSGSASKGRLLAQIEKENCHIIIGEPCGPHENAQRALDRAKGDFVFFVCDDDACFDRAIAKLPEKIEQIGDDASVAGIAGLLLIDSTQGSSVIAHQNLEADDPLARVTGWLGANYHAQLIFSPIRRELLVWMSEILAAKPFKLSFDDQICGLLYLLRGKFVCLDRLLYAYDPGNWETSETGQQEDLKYYNVASVDPAINKLHWLLCGFEGAALVRNLVLTPDNSLAKRQEIADCWFALMFRRFKLNRRADFGSPLSAEAEKLCVKWREAEGQVSFAAILADICQFLALDSPERAMTYFNYWSSILGLRQVSAA